MGVLAFKVLICFLMFSRKLDSTKGLGNPRNETQQPPKAPDMTGTICESACACKDTQIRCNKRKFKKIPNLRWPSGMVSASFDDNSIAELKPNEFNKRSMTAIKGLSIASNRIKKISRNTFKGLSSLRELLLSSNQISSIENGAFDGLRSLEVLNLEENRLKEINADEFTKLRSLRKLYVDGNGLKFIPVEIFENIPYLSLISLGGNLWKCDCNLLGLYLWVSPDKDIKGNPTCNDPDDLKGRQMVGFKYKDVQAMCKDPWDDDSESDDKLEKINETCSEHTSDDPIEICFISEDVFTSSGKHVCLHCVGTTEEVHEDGNQDDNYEYLEEDRDLKTSWKVPESANSTSFGEIRFVTHDNGSLCISSIQVSDDGEYVCSIKLKNFTKTESLKVSVASLATKVAIGVVVGVTVIFVAISVMTLRWWVTESGSGDISQVGPMGISKN